MHSCTTRTYIEMGRTANMRTGDAFRVNLHLTFTFNNSTVHGTPPKHLYLRAGPLNFWRILG